MTTNPDLLTKIGDLQQYERYLPSAFDSSLSILEKLNKVIEIVIELALENVSDDVIMGILQGWLEDGTLRTLLADLINDTEALDAFKAELGESLTTKIIHFNGNAKGKIKDNSTIDRQELQIYGSGDEAYQTGSKGAGMHLYGNGDIQHAGNIAFMTGQDDQGDGRMIISGGSNNALSDGHRTNTDTRVTIGNAIFDFVDTQQDSALLNLKNPSGRPAICFFETSSDEGELSVPTGERLSIGHWEPTTSTFTENVAMDGSGRFIIKTGAVNGDDAKTVDTQHTPNLQVFGETQSKSSELLANYSNDGSSSANLYLGKSPSGTVGTNTATRVDDVLGEVAFAGNNGSGFETGALISASVQTSNWTSTSNPTRLQLKTTPENSTTPATRMTINATGSIS
ncbi:MAG TPA: hypothetical protein VNU45_14575, partial [Rummeliibacillus sp.]|nr:hypothetical protein [Rummeliibacillus sp.]